MNVRGVRNIPCETKPGKRAPTVELCESDEQYVPLNDGLNWKGDPNATMSGQGAAVCAAPGPAVAAAAGHRRGASARCPVAGRGTGLRRSLRSRDRRLHRPGRETLHTGRLGASRQQDLAVDARAADALTGAW